MKSTISRSIRYVSLFLLLVLAATSVAQTVSAMLTDAEAQALIQKFQAQPSAPLTRIETQRLLKYLIAKNADPVAASALQPQPQGAGTSTGPAGASQQPLVQLAAEIKKKKATRIGIPLPKWDFGQGSQGPATGETLRLLESQYLGGPNIEIVPLTALLESQIDAEAKQKGCDYVVYSAMTQKKNSGMGFLKGASALMSVIPAAAVAKEAAWAIAASATASAASSAANMSSQVKAKNEVTFEYHMFAPGNTTPILENKSTFTAKTDGEDVITPLVEAAATSIVAKVVLKS
jgi:hypothetical protein